MLFREVPQGLLLGPPPFEMMCKLTRRDKISEHIFAAICSAAINLYLPSEYMAVHVNRSDNILMK